VYNWSFDRKENVMRGKKTTDLTTVPTAAAAATGSGSINLLPLAPDRADYHRATIAGLTIPLLRAQLDMVGEMKQNLDVTENELQQQLDRLLPRLWRPPYRSATGCYYSPEQTARPRPERATRGRNG
jgi:hypothetical protein